MRMSPMTKGLLLIAFCSGFSYMAGKYPLFNPSVSACREIVYDDIITHREYEAKLQGVVTSDFLTELSKTLPK